MVMIWLQGFGAKGRLSTLFTFFAGIMAVIYRVWLSSCHPGESDIREYQKPVSYTGFLFYESIDPK
jgi:hypothetical protein